MEKRLSPRDPGLCHLPSEMEQLLMAALVATAWQSQREIMSLCPRDLAPQPAGGTRCPSCRLCLPSSSPAAADSALGVFGDHRLRTLGLALVCQTCACCPVRAAGEVPQLCGLAATAVRRTAFSPGAAGHRAAAQQPRPSPLTLLPDPGAAVGRGDHPGWPQGHSPVPSRVIGL